MAAKIKVAIAGATGNLGGAVTSALLDKPELYEIFTLVRPASVNKPLLSAFSARGAVVKAVDFGAADALVEALAGVHVVISCLTLLQQKEELALIEASSQAKVHRYVPSFFGPACPPKGVTMPRDVKEDVLNHIKRIYLPYTVIDVGWFYQISLPQLPSGRIKTKVSYAFNEMIGSGDVRFALTHTPDIGKYVARIIADPRTLNKMVFVYAEMWTQNRIFDVLEEKSGEKIVRKSLSKEDIENTILDAQKALGVNPTDMDAMAKITMMNYKRSICIRGDNTPEHAKYLGYLDGKELYPDVEVEGLETFMKRMLDGEIEAIYAE